MRIFVLVVVGNWFDGFGGRKERDAFGVDEVGWMDA